jgi:hypothetical protein
VTGCTVRRLLGGDCAGAVVEVGRIDGEPVASCEEHRELGEALVGELQRRREPRRCRHTLRTREARRLCEARLARQGR